VGGSRGQILGIELHFMPLYSITFQLSVGMDGRVGLGDAPLFPPILGVLNARRL